jgi:hypothetical protein
MRRHTRHEALADQRIGDERLRARGVNSVALHEQVNDDGEVALAEPFGRRRIAARSARASVGPDPALLARRR